MSIILKLLLLGLTAVMAGLVPTLLFFRTAADRRVVIVGAVAVVGSYVMMWLGLPPLALLHFNGLNIYPIWAILLGFPVALVWRLLAAAAPPLPSGEERKRRIEEEAREKARRLNRR